MKTSVASNPGFAKDLDWSCAGIVIVGTVRVARSPTGATKRSWRRGTPAADSVVEPAHMELAEPSIPTAFDACVAAGATTVVIAPFFLWPGNHWDRDIPVLAAGVSARHPGVGYLVTALLGPHPLLSDIVDEHIQHCVAHASGEAPECELCAATGRCQLR